ncbi:MAG: hypothetical protein FWD39_06185 [Clostridiales bacterium]|nr:hypothetical protein [Clostridiales bacterium]
MKTDDQIIFDACYVWSLNILRQLEKAKLITTAELERIAKLNEQHYRPGIIVL